MSANIQQRSALACITSVTPKGLGGVEEESGCRTDNADEDEDKGKGSPALATPFLSMTALYSRSASPRWP